MSQGVLLVSETKLKNFTNTHQNLDVELMLPNIQVAQDLGLQNLLGGRFYDEIINQVSGGTLTSDNRYFLENYIQPYLLWRAYWETIPQVYMRMMNKTIVVGDTEQGKAVGIKEMQYLREIAQSRYEFYAQRLMDQLRNYPNLYPAYYSYSTKDGMPPSRVTYFAGIHFEPGYRYPPRQSSWANNLPKYYGGEYDCCGGYYQP
jgi:hypothetical protein